MKNGFRSSGLTGEHLTAALLLVFIGLSAFAMFTTSGTGDEMNWIGINVERLDAETQAARGIPAGVVGVIVQEVDGIAGRAGVLPGDVIVGINGNVGRPGELSVAGAVDASPLREEVTLLGGLLHSRAGEPALDDVDMS